MKNNFNLNVPINYKYPINELSLGDGFVNYEDTDKIANSLPCDIFIKTKDGFINSDTKETVTVDFEFASKLFNVLL